MSAAKKNTSSVVQELFKAGLYKKNQGRLTRQLTAIGILAVIGYGLWTLAKGPLSTLNVEPGVQPWVSVGLPLIIFVAAVWVVYRIVNYPKFADFLIAVEAEMDKVTWSTKGELYRATVVVLVVMVAMTALLFAYDWIWSVVFKWIGFTI